MNATTTTSGTQHEVTWYHAVKMAKDPSIFGTNSRSSKWYVRTPNNSATHEPVQSTALEGGTRLESRRSLVESVFPTGNTIGYGTDHELHKANDALMGTDSHSVR